MDAGSVTRSARAVSLDPPSTDVLEVLGDERPRPELNYGMQI
jgi:hypothetical protein